MLDFVIEVTNKAVEEGENATHTRRCYTAIKKSNALQKSHDICYKIVDIEDYPCGV